MNRKNEVSKTKNCQWMGKNANESLAERERDGWWCLRLCVRAICTSDTNRSSCTHFYFVAVHSVRLFRAHAPWGNSPENLSLSIFSMPFDDSSSLRSTNVGFFISYFFLSLFLFPHNISPPARWDPHFERVCSVCLALASYAFFHSTHKEWAHFFRIKTIQSIVDTGQSTRFQLLKQREKKPKHFYFGYKMCHSFVNWTFIARCK